ncbi:MAG: ABC transporter substrate-binding protein [Actinomycetota bacterium]
MVEPEQPHPATDRRVFLRGAVAAGAGLALAPLAGCSDDGQGGVEDGADSPIAEPVAEAREGAIAAGMGSAAAVGTQAVAAEGPELEWEMPTVWAATLPGDGAGFFAERVSALTDGRFRIVPRSSGEVLGPFDVLPAVGEGTYPIGITLAYFHREQAPALAFSTTVPFGLSVRQALAWFHLGGGRELLRPLFARAFNVVQFPVGSKGAQMGGWFRREVVSLDGFKGLRMRIPGLGGAVLSRMGVETVTLPSGELAAALEDGSLDAAEFVGPADDLSLGLHEAAPFYYFPGFWEPSAMNDLVVNTERWAELPERYRQVLASAAAETATHVTASYDLANADALGELVRLGISINRFPDDILSAGRAATAITLDELAADDADFRQVYASWTDFRRLLAPWFGLAEAEILR